MDISTDCCTMSCVIAFSRVMWNTCRTGSGWPHSTDAHQDWRIVQAVVAVQTASREEIQAHVAPAVSPMTTGNRLFAAGLRSLVPLARLYDDTAKHGYSGVVKESTGEWNGVVVFSNESRFCLYASDGHTRMRHRPGESHLLECTRPWHTGHTSSLTVWRAISYNLRSHLMFLQDKVTVPATMHRLLTLCYHHFYDRKVMCCFSRTTHTLIRLLRWLFVVYNNCPVQQETNEINEYWFV